MKNELVTINQEYLKELITKEIVSSFRNAQIAIRISNQLSLYEEQRKGKIECLHDNCSIAVLRHCNYLIFSRGIDAVHVYENMKRVFSKPNTYRLSRMDVLQSFYEFYNRIQTV